MQIVINGRTVEKPDKIAKLLIAKGRAVQSDRPESMVKKSETKNLPGEIRGAKNSKKK